MEYTNIEKKYVPLKENGMATHLKCEFYYSKGGYNVFTYKEEKRGYYVSVSPVTKQGNMESYTAFSGVKECIHEVTRKSKSAEEKAKKIAEYRMAVLVQYMQNKHGYEVAE